MADNDKPPRVKRNIAEVALEAGEAFDGGIAFQIRRGFRTERVTFAQLGLLVRRTANWLTSTGLQVGDRVVIWAPNMPEYSVLLLGAWLAGVVVVPIDIRTKPDVIDRFVADAEPGIGFQSRLRRGCFGPPVRQTFLLEDLPDLIKDSEPAAMAAGVTRDALAEIAYTSGTTALPKGVMLTHGNLLSQVEALRIAFPLQAHYRLLSLLPLSHVFEQAVDLLLPLSFGVPVTYVARINTATVGRTLREEGITCVVAVPDFLRMLLAGIERTVQERGAERSWRLAQAVARMAPIWARRLLFRQVHHALGGALEIFASGSARLDSRVAEAWERIGVRVYEGYGLTESAAAAALNSPAAARLGAAGRPLPGVDIRIASDGEILLRGPTITPGYFHHPELTERSFKEGWFRTGDVGFMDGDGFLHVTGRQAFRIVLPGGQKVYPEDLEHALNAHQAVRDSCVVGIDRNGRETVHAVLLMDRPELAAEVIRETNRSLGSHQQIASWTVWTGPDLPRTPLLKVDRKLVAAAVATQPGAASAGQRDRPPETAGPDLLAAVIARVSSLPASAVADDAQLGADLGLDSLGVVELVSGIEEELGRAVDELEIEPQTTVGQLRRLVETASPAETRPAAALPRPSRWRSAMRDGLQWLAFRLQDHWMRCEVVHPERAASLPLPSIVIFNYQAAYVPLAILRGLPHEKRARVTIAAASRLWKGRDRWQGRLLGLAGQAFPFATATEGAVGRGLAEMGRRLDTGYAVIISPEGGPEEGDQLRPFLPGAGLLAVEMGVPVVPFKVVGYGRLFPANPPFPFLPTRRGRFRLIAGEPLHLPPSLSYREAAERMRQALIETA